MAGGAHQPGLPEIHDEAADTPMWVPALGLGLFLVAALWMVLSSILPSSGEETNEAEAAQVEPAGEEPAPAGEEPAAE